MVLLTFSNEMKLAICDQRKFQFDSNLQALIRIINFYCMNQKLQAQHAKKYGLEGLTI